MSKLFNIRQQIQGVAGIFDYIPLLAISLLVLGLVGVIVYEKTRPSAE